MIIEINEDEWEVEETHYTCPFHIENPGKHYAGCSCSSSWAVKRKVQTKDEVEDVE